MTKKRNTAKKATSAKKSKRPAKKSFRGALLIATSARKSIEEGVAALIEMSPAIHESDENLQAVLNVLRDKNQPVEIRLAALKTLQAASFSVIAFESCRPDYIATLREVVDDPNLELRQRVLGILAREKDGFAQKRLLEGLQSPEKELVPPEKALQLLSYDAHTEAYSIAREIASNPPNATAKQEALRLLAADATAAPLFEKILRDKDELSEIRQISASALHSIRPEKLQKHAREILLDPSEYSEIQATSLTALTQFGDDEAVANDKVLMKRVDHLRTEASTKVKQVARRFLSKYSR